MTANKGVVVAINMPSASKESRGHGKRLQRATRGAKAPLRSIVLGVLTATVFVFLVAILGRPLWSGKKGESIPHEPGSASIGVPSETRAVPPGKVLEAAQRFEDAKVKVSKAQGEVDRLEKEARDAKPDEKGNAERELSDANDKLLAAQSELQFEGKRLSALTDDRPQFGRATSRPLNYLVFGVLGLVVLGFLMYGIASHKLLPLLASITVSRGLITFLIAMVTVTIALILVLATVVSDDPDLADRFMQGKEVLTMLIGVLGTIVGFYFGNAEDGKKSLSIAAPAISNEAPVTGGKIDLRSFVSSGRPPYSYQVLFTPKNVIPDQEGRSEDGWIQLRDLPIDSDFAGGKVSYEIIVHDVEGRTESRGGSLKVTRPQAPPVAPVVGAN